MYKQCYIVLLGTYQKRKNAMQLTMKNKIVKLINQPFIKSSLLAMFLQLFALSFFYASGTFMIASEKDAIYELISQESRASENDRSHLEFHKENSFDWNGISSFFSSSANHRHTYKLSTFISTYALTTMNSENSKFKMIADDQDFYSSSLTLPSVGYYNDTDDETNSRYLMFNTVELYRYKYIPNDWKNVSNSDGYSFCYLSHALADEILSSGDLTSYDDLIGKNVTIKVNDTIDVTLTISNIIMSEGAGKQIDDLYGNYFISYNPDIVRNGYTKMCTEFRSSIINIRDYFEHCYKPFWEDGCSLHSIKILNNEIVVNDYVNKVNSILDDELDGLKYSNDTSFYIFFSFALAFLILSLLALLYSQKYFKSFDVTVIKKRIHMAFFVTSPFILINSFLTIYTCGLNVPYFRLLVFNYFGSIMSLASLSVLFFSLIIYKLVVFRNN